MIVTLRYGEENRRSRKMPGISYVERKNEALRLTHEDGTISHYEKAAVTEISHDSETVNFVDVNGIDEGTDEGDGEAESDEWIPDVGDTVVDMRAPEWTENSLLCVEEIADYPANKYIIDTDGYGGSTTVADENREFPADDTVVVALPEGADESYAYPKSRLEPYGES